MWFRVSFRCCHCIPLSSLFVSLATFLLSWDVMNTKIKDKSVSAKTHTHTLTSHRIDNVIGSHVRTTFHRFLCLNMCQTLAHRLYIKRLMRKLAARWTSIRAPIQHMFKFSCVQSWFFPVPCSKTTAVTRQTKAEKDTHCYVLSYILSATQSHKENGTRDETKRANERRWNWHTLENRQRITDITFYTNTQLCSRRWMSILMDQTSVDCDAKCSASAQSLTLSVARCWQNEIKMKTETAQHSTSPNRRRHYRQYQHVHWNLFA